MQKKVSIIAAILTINIFVILTISYAQTSQIRNQIFIGARPMGMGEAFVAVADDGNAIYWNPAGLPNIDYYELSSMYANLFNTGVKNNYVSLTLPYSEKLAFGLDWFNLGLGDKELDFNRNMFNFSLGAKVLRGISLGTNIKRLITNASLDGYSEGNASGWGADLGLLISPGTYSPFLNGLKFGIMAHDFTNTKIKYDNGVSEVILPRNIRYGASYLFNNFFFFERPLVALDVDDRIHFGTELWLPPLLNIQLGMRAGLQRDIYAHGEKEFIYSFGTSIKYQIKDGYLLNVDYAYTDLPVLANTSRFSVGFSFSLPSSPVKIDTVHISDIYASFYPYHAEHPCGSVRCTYDDSKKIEAQIKLQYRQYGISSEEKIVFNPEMQPDDSVKEIDLIPVFSPNILDVKGEDRVRAQIEVKPKSLMRIKAEKAMSNIFTIYGIGKINWAFGEDQAAAFVTAEDPIIKKLASDIVRRNQNQPITITESVTNADHIFNYLKRFGIGYIGDSKSTYGKMPIDNIYYPRELLAKKMGDCDDSVVLLASLYQSIGIPTAFECIPEHIFMMFDTGLSKNERFRMCLPSNMYCIKDNKVWVPIETTWMDKPFYEAWERGANLAKEYQNSNELKIVEINAAEQKYKPIPVNALERIITKSEVVASLNEVDVQQDRNTITSRQQEHIKTMEDSVAQHPDNLQLRNELATTYAMIGNPQRAKDHYQIILEKDFSNFNALNNLANIYFLEGILDSAQISYVLALENAPTFRDSNGVYLNLGLLYAAAETEILTWEMFANVVRDIIDTTKVYTILLSRVEDLLALSSDEGTKADKEKKLKKISPSKVKELVKETIEKKIKPRGYKISRISATKQRRPKEDIEDVFFWSY